MVTGVADNEDLRASTILHPRPDESPADLGFDKLRVVRQNTPKPSGMNTFFRCVTGLIPRSSFRRHAAALGGGALAAQAVQALATPILGRLYDPSAFGVFTLLLSAAAIPAAIGGLRYELAIVLAKNNARAMNIVALQTICNIASTGLSLLAVLFFRNQIAAAFGVEELGLWLFLAPLVVFLTNAWLAVTYWLVRTKQFASLARCRVAQTSSAAGVQMAASFLFHGGPLGLIVGFVIGQCVPLLVLLKQVRLGYSKLLRDALSLQYIRQSAVDHSNFPKYTVPYGFAAVLRERGLVLLLGLFASTHVIGLFALALRLVYMPVGLISGSISTVLYQRVANERDVSVAGPLTYRILTTLVTAATPAFVFIAWHAQDVFAVLLGSQWRDAGLYAALMATPACTYLLSGVLDRMLDVVGHQRTALLIEAAYSSLAVLVFLVGLYVFKSAPIAVTLFAAVTACYHVVWMFAVYRCCRFPLSDLLRIALKAALVVAFTTSMLLTASLAFVESTPLWAGLAVLASCYGVVFAVAGWPRFRKEL